ncbi:MAG: hypothetical protein EHM88_03380 [Candidatus Rokuibacteriota bacterium]|nr:MAG: hypothetical protein EHM88_03380 [Candidatus Rokubacteria bacterium]
MEDEPVAEWTELPGGFDRMTNCRWFRLDPTGEWAPQILMGEVYAYRPEDSPALAVLLRRAGAKPTVRRRESRRERLARWIRDGRYRIARWIDPYPDDDGGW